MHRRENVIKYECSYVHRSMCVRELTHMYIWGECTYRDPVHFIKAHYITFNSWKGMRVIEEGGRKGGGKRRGGNR